ncbi:MAG: ABC transporter permease [Candidatus Omnitrophica bacterium]|nr:ABC transporter permease [Candidatus Omnitrophota bacterium]
MIELAFRYLLARRRQTVLMLLGFFFGSAAFVLLSGIMLGFRYYLVYQLINNDAHVHIQAREEFLTEHSLDASFYGMLTGRVFWNVPPSGKKDSDLVENPQAWYERLEKDPRVVAYTPRLSTAVLFSKGKATATATLIGCDPKSQTQVTTLGDYVTEGKFDALALGGNQIAIGERLRKKLGVTLSQNVLVSVAEQKPVPFKVVAIFSTGNQIFDEQAYGSLEDVQAVNQTPNEIDEIAVRLVDYKSSSAVAKSWSLLSEEKIESWDQKNANIYSVFRIQDAVRFLSIGSIMIVAGFGIYNVLNITVIQKRKDIAILRSMGYTTRDIVLIFFAQGLALGIAGTTLGLLFGYAFSFFLETIRIGAGPLGIGVDHLIVSREFPIYLQSAFLALSSASLASILPAATAGKLTPIEIIRSSSE